MKIKKETHSQTIKRPDIVGVLKQSSATITNCQANNERLISEVLGATDTVLINSKVVTEPVDVLKTQNAACDNSQGSWQHDGILRQALLSGISSSQTENSNTSMSVDTVLPKLQETILSSVDSVKLSEDMTPVSLSGSTLAQNSFSANEFSSTITSSTLPFTSLSLGTLPSNSLSSECDVPAQEPSLPIINQIPSCDVHQSPLHNKSRKILSDTSNNTISNPGINSSESATDVECISSPLMSAVPSYPVTQSNLVCQAFASLSSKDNSVTVVYSTVPKAESLPSHLIQKTGPLPSMSEVKSSLSNSINTLPSTQNKTTDDIHNKVSLALSGIASNTNPTLEFESITSNEVDGSLGAIKLDEQSNSADFNGESSISPEAVKFNNDSVASDIPSRIVIPVSSDVILTKINAPNSSSHQDISHIITIPLPAGTIYNSSLVPMPLTLPSNIPPGSSVSMTPTIVSNLPYSLAGITNPVSNQCWPSSGITLNVTNTSNSQISTSVTSSLPVSIMSVAPPITSLPNSNLVHFASNTLPTSQVTAIRTIPQDPVCYTVQSPAEILSQLSKAGVFPTMSSSQVSSVLSALGSDSHVDSESDPTHNEMLNSQVLSNEKVSTLTQTDSLEMNIMQQEEKIIQLLGGQHLLEHSINGSQMIMPSSSQTPVLNSDGSLNNNELVAENVNERKRVNSPFPRVVAVVLNSPPINNEKLLSTNVNNNGVLRNCEKEHGNVESHSEHPTNSPSDSLHEFLVPPSNTKPLRKRQKKTSALREMLLGVCNTSGGSDKQSKKPRSKSKKVNNGSTTSPSDSLKISENVHLRDIGMSLETVQDNSQFTKEAECYKCKSCPFLSLEETSMLQHIKEKHCSEEQQLSIMRQKLKCPGCANVFYTINSLEVHLKQDHQVNTPELKAITSSAIRIATEGNVKLPQTKKKKKKPSCKNEGKINVNSNSENTVQCNGNMSNMAGSSSCIISMVASRGALIFSTNNNSESEILTSDQKICVKDLPNGNTISTIDKSVICFKNILISSSKEGESLGSQEQIGNGFDGGSWNQLTEGVVNTALPLTKGEKFSESKTDEKVNVVAQKRKRGRPKGSKSSTLIVGMMGDKDDGQSPKITNSGHRCNVDNCAVTLRSPENIEYHRSCHNGPEFRCPECAHTHCHWNGLSTHLWRVHMVDMELYTCDQCNYKTVSYAKLVNLHKKIHGSERPFLCDSCGKGFKNRKQLRNHKSIHQPKQTKLGECEICGRTFNNTRMLRTHLDNVHNKLRPHLCNYCGYSASSVGSLKMHMRKHTGEKPFRCNLCDYCTADHNSLRRHKMRHTGDKPYKCPHCPYACIQSSTYKAHLKTKHPGMDDGLMFSCNICSFRSVKEENYIAHLAEHKRPVKSLPAKVNRLEKDVVPDKLDVEEQPSTVIELVEHLENGTSERFSMEKLGGLDSICDVQMTLESDFETEEITDDISEAELITGDLGEPQDFKICENELKIKSHNEDLHTATL